MFEGKHIHFSALDQKPLCSFSTKICKQRRINGFAFCIRHILEDKSAPFKQCAHVAKYNNQKCTNPIPANEQRQYCNSHMQAAGILPKKDRKDKNQSNSGLKNQLLHQRQHHLHHQQQQHHHPQQQQQQQQQHNSISKGEAIKTNVPSTGTLSISLSSSSPGSAPTPSITTTSLNTGDPSVGSSLKITIPTISSPSTGSRNTSSTISSSNKHLLSEKLKSLINGSKIDLMRITSTTPINGRGSTTFGPSSGLSTINNNKDNTITISITSTTSKASSHCQPAATPSVLKEEKESKTKESKKGAASGSSSSKKKTKRKDTASKGSKAVSHKKVVFARKKQTRRDCEDLFDYNLYHSSSSDDEEGTQAYDSEEDIEVPCFLIPLVTLTKGDCDLEVSELRNKLISQKWLLSSWVKLKETHLKEQINRTKRLWLEEKQASERKGSYADTLLEMKSRRVPSTSPTTPRSLRKGICCFENDESKCLNPSIPFTRHCQQHILYNVDQLLFERCTAKSSTSFTQCSNPTFDVDREEPLCEFHVKRLKTGENGAEPLTEVKVAVKENAGSLAAPVASKARKKTKPMALTRPGRRKKRKAGGGCSLDSVLSQDSNETVDIVSSTNQNDLQADATATSAPVASSPTLTVPISSPTSSTFTSTSITMSCHLVASPQVFESMIIPSSARPIAGSGARAPPVPGHPEIPPGLDVEVPHLAPGEEALVASLVADLPPLGSGPDHGVAAFDADLTEVLNKIPDDAFNDLFVDNLKNGEPSREEAEALERALAAVNKECHSLAAAVVASTTPEPVLVGPNGDATSYYSHQIKGHGPGHLARPPASSLNLNENDILGLATNIFGSLTSEQQQQLNGLIDGALASGSMVTSPTLKSALTSLPNPDFVMPPGPGQGQVPCVPVSGTLQPNSHFNGPAVKLPGVGPGSAPGPGLVSNSTTIQVHHNSLCSAPPPYAQFNSISQTPPAAPLGPSVPVPVPAPAPAPAPAPTLLATPHLTLTKTTTATLLQQTLTSGSGATLMSALNAVSFPSSLPSNTPSTLVKKKGKPISRPLFLQPNATSSVPSPVSALIALPPVGAVAPESLPVSTSLFGNSKTS